jgi:CheY-like chemotaxis protein
LTRTIRRRRQVARRPGPILRREGAHASAPRPDLILLDLNLPRKDGRELLDEVKDDPALSSIPVVVLTTSRAERDVLASCRLQDACYITKPVNLDQLMDVLKSVESFWLTVRHKQRGWLAN